MNIPAIIGYACLVACVFTSDFQKVVVIGTNDIHGAALPVKLFRPDTNQSYSYGGLPVMAELIRIIKEQNQGNVIWLDAGDQFQGGIQSSPLVSNGEIMNDFYNLLSVEASAIGNHQFDMGPNFLFPYWNSRTQQSVNLAANLLSEKNESQFLPKQKNSTFFTLKNGLKVGVIGLSTIQTPESTNGFAQKLFPKYNFLPYVQIVTKQTKKLRLKGADIVLIVSHLGNACNANNIYGIWEESTQQSSYCLENDELSVLLHNLPDDVQIDGVVQGHRHTFSHHFIKGVPVMGTINGGYYFNTMTIQLYKKQTYHREIEGPIPVCDRIFQLAGTCNYLPKNVLPFAGPLIKWRFHTYQVKPNPQLQQIYNTKWIPIMQKQGYLQDIVKNEIYLSSVNTQQSQLGNLFTNLIHEASSPNDFVILNPGGFRTAWAPGIVQYQHLYGMLPFNNTIISFQMTGYEFLETLRIIQSGKRGFYNVYGVKQRASYNRLNGQRNFISAELMDGSEISLETNYRVVSISFLMQGGDDFKDVMGKVYELRKEKLEGEIRQTVKPYLKKMEVIREGSLIDPLNPRLVVDYI